MERDPLTGGVNGSAIELQRAVGLGLLINFNVEVLKNGIKRFKL